MFFLTPEGAGLNELVRSASIEKSMSGRGSLTRILPIFLAHHTT